MNKSKIESYSSRNLKINLDYDKPLKNKFNEIYSIIGISKVNKGKINLIKNEPPSKTQLFRNNKEKNLSKIQINNPTISLSNINIKKFNNNKFSSLSSDRKIINLKKKNISYNNSSNESIKKYSLNKKSRNIPLNKKYYKNELETLNTLLFGYNDYKKIYSNKYEDPFYSQNNLNLNKRERLLSGGNILLHNLINSSGNII